MAGEALNTDIALKVLAWVGSGIAYGSGLIMYVKMQLKAHSKELELHAKEIQTLQRAQSLAVRPEDIKLLRDDIRELRNLIMSKNQ